MSFEKVPSFLVNFSDAEMKSSETRSYRFKSFLLDAAERQLSRDDELVQLTPKAFDVLVYLVEHGGHLVEKDELKAKLCLDDARKPDFAGVVILSVP